MGYKLGLVSVSFRDRTPKEILEKMKESALLYIEWGSDVHAPKDDISNLLYIAQLQKEYGIICSSYGTYFRLGSDDISQLDGYIYAAKLLGTNILRLWCGNKGSGEYSLCERQQLFEQCRAAAKKAAENGVVFCMECHINTYTDTIASATELMREVGCENFCMYWQPNQFMTHKDNILFAQKMAQYTKNIHVFNWEGKQMFPLIEGKEIWRKYLSNFSQENTLLLEFMPDGRFETLAREASALKEIIKTI